MLAGIGRAVMPKRVSVERTISVEVRRVVGDWVDWLIRRERIIAEGQPSRRLDDLDRLSEAIRAGDEVELDGGDLPGSLNPKPGRSYRLAGDRLIEY